MTFPEIEYTKVSKGKKLRGSAKAKELLTDFVRSRYLTSISVTVTFITIVGGAAPIVFLWYSEIRFPFFSLDPEQILFFFGYPFSLGVFRLL